MKQIVYMALLGHISAKSLVQINSVPACTSYECQKGDGSAGVAYEQDIPSKRYMSPYKQQKYDAHTKYHAADVEKLPKSLSQIASIPACTSFECQKGDGSAGVAYEQDIPSKRYMSPYK